MTKSVYLLGATLLTLVMIFGVPASAQARRIIFDTDVGNDIDDALALAMIHALDSRGEARLLAVTITKDNKWAAPYVDLVNTFYGRGDIPIGVVKAGKTPEDSPLIRIPAQKTTRNGGFLYPHDLLDGTNAAEAVALLRRILAREQDQSVTIIQVGFSTNLARLLNSNADSTSPLPGKALIKRKVRMLSVMAGAFPTGEPEYNIRMDIPSAKQLFAEWPTPIVVSGFEVGKSILYPAKSIESDYRYVENHPVSDAYRNYQKMPYDRPTWDLTSVLYAIRPDQQYFDLSPFGKITVDDNGKTRFQPSSEGMHRHLIVSEGARQRVLEAMISLSSQPPCSPAGR